MRNGTGRGWVPRSGGAGRSRPSLAMLVAMGVLGVAGMGKWAWAQEGGQAVDPVNISGGQATSNGATPSPRMPAAHAEQPVERLPEVRAATPSAPMEKPVEASAAANDDAGGQAVTPVNVSPQPGAAPTAAATPAASPPEAPAAAASPAAAPATSKAPAQATAMTPSTTAPAGSATTRNAVAVQNGRAYPLTGVKINYLKDHPGEPPVSELLNTPIKLGVSDGGYVAARPGMPSVSLKLSEIGKGDVQKIYRSGIETIYGQVVRFFNERGIIGVFVVVDAKDIDANDNDIRPKDRTTLQFIVVTSTVTNVRTVATGDKVPEGERVDNPKYEWIRQRSPLKGEAAGRSDLLNKDALDEYVLRLNRQPGRRVDVAVSGTDQLGGVTLDYLVSENRPWYVFAQVSNTGTKQTNQWRERFGAVDNQLTGHDDVFSLDYLTAGFDASHAVVASYELPFFGMERLRYKVYGSWDEFTASDVGQNNANFTGNQWTAGNEMILNVFQHRELFIDAVGGFRAEGVETNNVTAQLEGNATYYAPYVGLRLDRATDLATTTGSLTFTSYLTDTDVSDIEALGRAKPTRQPVVLEWDLSQSLYLEPLLDPDAFAAGQSTLANEVYVGTRGQWTPDRLFPQIQDVAGGLYSVRGYPESITAGDSVVIGTVEYRFHLPRALAVQPDPTKTPFLWNKQFRFSPQQAYGRPDWDLIGRAFVDVAQVWNTDRLAFERDDTLAGAGVGVELQFEQNFNVRLDWGFALVGIPDEVDQGSNRLHVSATILY